MLWTAPVTFPMMAAVQEICDRAALATGESIGTLIRRKFSRKPRIVIAVLVCALLVAIINGIAAAPFLVVTRVAATIGWATAAIMVVAGAIGIWTTVTGRGG